MVALITLDEAKDALKVNFTEDDALIADLIQAASEEVVAYLDKRAPFVLNLDENGEFTSATVVPARIKTATNIIVQYLYESEDQTNARAGGIPRRAEMMLYRFADPPCV